MKRQHALAAFSTLMVATLLSACGGGDDSAAPAPAPAPAPSASSFTQTATWAATVPAAGTSVCYDFDTQAEVPGCAGTAWDLKLTNSARGTSLWTNGGVSGAGNGAAVGGPFDFTWADLQTWQNGSTDPDGGALPPQAYLKDASSSVFTGDNPIQAAAFEYGVNGDHLLYPNYRTFLITTQSSSADNIGTNDDPVFALQVTGYYGGAGGTTSGHPSFRWVDRTAPSVVRNGTVDASAGWAYYNLNDGDVVTAEGDWHIAFNRYNIKLNGGQSGPATLAGFVGKTAAGFYDANGAPVAAKFTAATNLEDTRADLSDPDLAVPANASGWIKDSITSPLNPQPTGSYPNPLDFGWYSYYPTAEAAAAAGLPSVAHLLKANPDGAVLLRSGEGNSYARVHLTEIRYADPNQSTSQQTWTFQLEIQPRP